MAYQPKKHRKFLATSLSAAMVASAVAPVAGFAANFSDLDESNQFFEQISALVEAGVLTGNSDGTFNPTGSLTRAEAAVIVSKLLGLEEDTTSASKFSDVKEGQWWTGYINAAAEAGIIAGYNGKFNPSDVLTRQDFAVIMAKAYALELKEGYEGSFSDVPAGAYYEEAVNILASHEIILGTGDGKFGVDGKMQRQHVALMAYKADIAFGDLLEKPVMDEEAPVLAYDGELELTVANGAEFTLPEVTATDNVDEEVEVFYTLTDAEGNDLEAIDTLIAGEYTLTYFAEDAAGNVSEELVITVTVESALPEVTGVSATNLKEFTVSFNQAVDADTVVEANFTIGGNNAADVVLSEDKKSVKVVIADANVSSVQPASYAVVVKDVKSAKGEAIVKYTENLKVFDNTVPTASAVKLVGPNKFEITFNEPVKTAGTVKVNNGTYAATVSPLNGSNVVTVTLAASSLPNGDYTISLAGFKDYAGFQIDATELTLNYAKETSIPTATVTSASQTEVKVTFDREVTLDATNSLKDYFYHTFSAWSPDTVTTTDNKTFTLTFTTYPIPEGTTNLVVKNKGLAASSEIKDAWGNKLESNITLPVTVTADKTSPTVDSVKVTNEKTVELYFSESMNVSKVEDETNFKVVDAEGKAVATGFTNSYDAVNKKVTLTFDSKLTGGNYTVEVKGQEDTALTANALATVTLPFTITDKTPIDPDANATDVVVTAVEESAADNSDIIYVTYAEKMSTTGQYSVLNAANYLLAGAALPANSTLELFGTTGKVVKITIPKADQQTVVGGTLTVGRVADLAGNTTTKLAYDRVVGTESAPTVTAVKQTGANTVEIVVNKPLKVVLASGFTTTNGALASIDSWSINSSNETVIKATVLGADASSATNTADILTAFNVAADILVSETGVKMAASDVSGLIADFRAPELEGTSAIADGVAADDNTFTINFTEDLTTTNETFFAQDLVITDVNGNVLVAGVDYTTAVDAVDASLLVVTVVNGDGKKYNVKSKESVTYIKDDANSNKAKAFTTAKEVTIN
ncbi:S-layer homology domain-containing protein [Mangrovibacillus cuniculi]|uniref:SLH domain-containing protein n=1 Tax=Mangrovibacillus cuniculi TaxID=2593652 RepID=A0A7S8CD28_9BACI|nr:S-layer homology domain-containing protein [Mangrovibacillus cuniculi]QPC47563.1 hypothetical protein G8O30_11680 [Mangrovibacillus cuniculi]